MTEFSVTILGCGSAKPSLRHNTSSQVVCYRDARYMLDCGEGTQIQLLKYKLHTGKLEHIFISHSHGDHCLGLVGLISSLALNNRYADIHLHIPADLEPILRAQIDFFVTHSEFEIHYHPILCDTPTPIFEDQNVKVTAFPLDHRVPCYGFLFQEKEGVSSRSYAYFSDTRPMLSYAKQLQGVNLLYHDATYADDIKLAVKYFHSTAIEAAEFAQACHTGRLLLGHFSTRYKDENCLLECAAKVFPETMMADEGLKVMII